jgi:TonB family protein
MNRLILALCIGLIPHALHAQTASPTPAAPVQERTTPQASSPPSQAELQEALKHNESVKQLYAAGNYKEALPQAERVLALLEKARGDEDPLVGGALHNLALLHLALKKFDKVEPVFERILVRREKSRLATSPATLGILINYRCLISARGASNPEEGGTLTDRINSILLQDSVLAAGLPLPDDLSELNSHVIFERPQPRYPREALGRRLQGTVVVWGETDEKGKMVKVEAVPCWEGQKLLADAAVEAMHRASLKPVLVNGKAIKLKVITTYSFVLQ